MSRHRVESICCARASKNTNPVLACRERGRGRRRPAEERRRNVQPRAPPSRGCLCGRERGRSPGSRQPSSPSQRERQWMLSRSCLLATSVATSASNSGGAAPDSHRLPTTWPVHNDRLCNYASTDGGDLASPSRNKKKRSARVPADRRLHEMLILWLANLEGGRSHRDGLGSASNITDENRQSVGSRLHGRREKREHRVGFAW